MSDRPEPHPQGTSAGDEGPGAPGEHGRLARALSRHVGERVPAHLELLREMVAINSFTGNAAGVDALGELTARRFEDLGFAAERVPSRGGGHGDHVVLTRPARIRDGDPALAPHVGLVSHLDTVFPPEEEVRHDFRWREVGDRIYGPGTVDIKGGTVMIHLVLEALAACAPEAFDRVGWTVLLDATEEVMSADFGALARARLGPGATACLVFEGGRPAEGGFRLVTSRKGMAVFDLDVTGRGAHAGVAPESGASAIWQLARTVDRVSALADFEQGLSVNVGTISGGETTNRVAHFATARLEMRAFDPHVLDAAISALGAIAAGADVSSHAGDFVCRVDLVQRSRMPPWPESRGSIRLFEHWRAAGAELGHEVSAEARGGLSDGNLMWDFVPTLDGLGPIGGNLHCSEDDPAAGKEQEYVERASFGPKAVLSALAIHRLIEDAGHAASR